MESIKKRAGAREKSSNKIVHGLQEKETYLKVGVIIISLNNRHGKILSKIQ